jgi:excisionase family DNA binding protein
MLCWAHNERGGDTLEDFLFVEEAAKELRVTRKTLYDWMREGKLDFVTIGGRRRISRAALLALVKPGRPDDESPISGVQSGNKLTATFAG